MQFIPIKTRILKPPQDDLLAVIQDSVADIKNGDVILISSKVIAIHEGRCVVSGEADKEALVAREADFIVPTSSPPTLTTLSVCCMNDGCNS